MALIFDASFESGNLAEAQLVCESPLEYDLHIRPDTLNTRHRVWFYFSVRGAIRGQKVLINLVGHSKTKSLYRDGMAPVVSSSRRPYWERMPEGCVYYYRSARHNKQYVLSFPFCFERADEVYYFAYCFPYTYSYLQRFLQTLDAKGLPHLRRECLTRTVQERRLDLLTISSPANLKLDAELSAAACAAEPSARAAAAVKAAEAAAAQRPRAARKSVLFVTSRVHPGESPASFLMHGLLLFLTSEHPKAVALREAVIIKIVPMLNPDGVFAGNYRCNSLGLDLNRRWHEGSPWSVPTVHAVRELAKAYVALPNAYNLEVFVDIHAHSTTMNGFVFANVPADPRQLEAVTAFPRVLGNHARDLAFSGCKLDNDPSKAGTGRRVLGEVLPGVHSYTLEVSFFCAGVGHQKGEAYSPQSYTEMGNAIGSALHEYYTVPRSPAPPLGAPAPAPTPAPAARAPMLVRRPSVGASVAAPRAPSASSDRETRANAEVLRERLDREHRANAILAAAERTARCSARSLTAAAAAAPAAAPAAAGERRPSCPSTGRARGGLGGGGLAAAAADWQLKGQRPPAAGYRTL